jgi:hypothetical protein
VRRAALAAPLLNKVFQIVRAGAAPHTLGGPGNVNTEPILADLDLFAIDGAADAALAFRTISAVPIGWAENAAP